MCVCVYVYVCMCVCVCVCVYVYVCMYVCMCVNVPSVVHMMSLRFVNSIRMSSHTNDKQGSSNSEICTRDTYSLHDSAISACSTVYCV